MKWSEMLFLEQTTQMEQLKHGTILVKSGKHKKRKKKPITTISLKQQNESSKSMVIQHQTNGAK